MSATLDELAAAIRELAQESLRTTYRADITEQLALRLLEHLAATDKAAAQRIAGEVKQHALAMGNPRDNPIEGPSQESMLELLNYVQNAAQGRSR